jgi:hypothetical protein
MQETKQLLPANRVRVDPAYWNAEVAGRTGTIALYPECATPQEGCLWVELDVDDWHPGVVDGAEVDAANLHLL